MKSYWIFAIILTVAYVIYYAVNIARDLYGKKSQGRTSEEIFELDPDDGQDSVNVTESETGFNVGTERYETDFAAVPDRLCGCSCFGAGRHGGREYGIGRRAVRPDKGGDGSQAGRNGLLPVGRIHGG